MTGLPPSEASVCGASFFVPQNNPPSRRPPTQNHEDRTASQAAFPFGHRSPCRQLYAEVPPRVEYSLTELGRSLIPIIDSLIEWALEHYTAVAGNNPR